MRKWTLMLILFALAAALVFTAPAWAGPCAENAYGLSTLRGDAQYPPGWAAGPIKISPPDELVFSVIDGALDPQQFVHIKAKLQNRLVDLPMGTGAVTAVARYRKRTDYQPDLSADPPDEESVEETFTSSVSDPVSVSEIPMDTAVELSFDFSTQPIPAGVTDLFLLVMFQGQIGDPAVTGLAVGIKDLNEPLHFTPWNYRDWFFLNFQLRPAQEVYEDPATIDLVAGHPECLILGLECIAPKSENCYIGFTANEEDQPIYVAYYENLAPGHHGRLIALLGEKNFYIHSRRERAADCSFDYKFVFPADSVINQIGDSGFTHTAVNTWRGIKTHYLHSSTTSCPIPENINVYRDIFASKPPADYDPAPATTITFP